MSNQIGLVDTQDFGLAVALVCKKYELIDLQNNYGSKRITFRFENRAGIKQDIQDYWNGKLSVNAKAYWGESKNLKTRLYSQG